MSACDIKFELIWRRGTTDMSLAAWTEHFDPTGGGNFDAQAHEYDETGPAVDYVAGDKFVLKFATVMATGAEAYIPNGDGPTTRGRVPNIRLPK